MSSTHVIPNTPTSNAGNQPVRLGETAIEVIAEDLIRSMRDNRDSFVRTILAEQVAHFRDCNRLGLPANTAMRSPLTSPPRHGGLPRSPSTRLLHEFAAMPYYPGRQSAEAQDEDRPAPNASTGSTSPSPPPPSPPPPPPAADLTKQQKLLNLLVYLHQKVQFFPILQAMVRMHQEKNEQDVAEIQRTIYNILATVNALGADVNLAEARRALNGYYAAKEGLREKIAGWKILADRRVPEIQDVQEMSNDD